MKNKFINENWKKTIKKNRNKDDYYGCYKMLYKELTKKKRLFWNNVVWCVVWFLLGFLFCFVVF